MSKLSDPAPTSGRGVSGCIRALDARGAGSTPAALTFFQNWRFRWSLDRNLRAVMRTVSEYHRSR